MHESADPDGKIGCAEYCRAIKERVLLEKKLPDEKEKAAEVNKR